jgi:hypothetical protein
MNDSTRDIRRPRPVWPPTARTAAAIIATLALLAAACGGSPSSTGSGGSPNAGGSKNSASAADFANCMRSHGVSRFPDPDSRGVLPKTDLQRLGVTSSQLNAAQRACQNLLPNGGSIEQCESAGVCSPVVTQQMLNAGLRFAQCMRSHGVQRWPDPTADSQGRVAFAISVSQNGFDPHSPQITNKVDECVHLMPGSSVPLAVSP